VSAFDPPVVEVAGMGPELFAECLAVPEAAAAGNAWLRRRASASAADQVGP